MMPNMDIRPRFQVEKLEGKVEVNGFIYKQKKLGNGKVVNERVEKTVERDAGYMVYTAKGDSFRVGDIKELKRLGMNRSADMIDMETGEPVPMMQMNLKEMVARKTKITPPERLRDLMEDE